MGEDFITVIQPIAVGFVIKWVGPPVIQFRSVKQSIIIGIWV